MTLGATALRFIRHRGAVASLVVVLALMVMCFAAPLFVPEAVGDKPDVTAIRESPSVRHLFGTDDIGRDLFVRAIYGGRISLTIGLLSAMISVVVGAAIGGIAGYSRGWIDALLMRATDALLSIPALFLLIFLTRVAGTSIAVITVSIAALSWMTVGRIVRANVLSLREQEFVQAARAIGVSPRRILLGHVLPNTLAPMLVAVTLGVGHAILMEASLSFLGLGVQPPTASWGSLLNRAQGYLVEAPWMALSPGLLILVTVLAVNFVGDGVQEATNPLAQRSS